MTFYRILFDDNRSAAYVGHPARTQNMYCAVERLSPGAIHTNGIPLALELDGWADDMAYPGETFETNEGFTVECITEEGFREETSQQDVPTYLLDNFVNIP